MALIYEYKARIEVNTSDMDDAEDILEEEFEDRVREACDNPHLSITESSMEYVGETDD